MTNNQRTVLVTGEFRQYGAPRVRFLEEASKLGRVTVLLEDDHSESLRDGGTPNFPLEERVYLLENNRYVSSVTVAMDGAGPYDPDLPKDPKPDAWVVEEKDDTPEKRKACERRGIAYRVVRNADLEGYPILPPPAPPSGRKKVIVTGCFDWFHSGHVRFFEEVSALGDLYVVVGSDRNVRLLKGEGHPLFHQEERRYLVQSVRYVTQALISSGAGWMDAEPEIDRIKPDLYAVNEDGDQPEKREYCRAHGLEYVVLRREPKPGLPRRQSTDLRGF
ncbi:MAG: adenylyltransferase/cytidyltransferase family protein [Anaerolineales bacterium]